MIKIYDLGGDSKIRGIWKNYLAEVHGCIYVVDGRDKSRVAESREALLDIYQNTKLMAINHQEEIDTAEIFNQMNLHVLFPDGVSNKSLKIQPCNVIYNTHEEPHTDPRIRLGFNWIVESVQEQMKTLESRRRIDIKQEMRDKMDRKRTMIPIIDKGLRRHKSKIVPEII